MTSSYFNSFLQHLQRLNRGGITGGGSAPHKPVLLISVIELIKDDHFLDNRIYITQELVQKYKHNCIVLTETDYEPDFTQPFYRLKNESIENYGAFWHLKSEEKPIDKWVSSFNRLRSKVLYAYFDPHLFEFIIKHTHQIIETLINEYFPERSIQYFSQANTDTYLTSYQTSILEDEVANYGDKYLKQEYTYRRSSLFKKNIPLIYNQTCSISGMQTIYEHQGIIDACHIVPISKNGEDLIRNGIALCPNIHRAFDKGLIGVDNNYQVIISDKFREIDQHSYNFKQLKNRLLLLPSEQEMYPSLEHFAWHREYVFLK